MRRCSAARGVRWRHRGAAWQAERPLRHILLDRGSLTARLSALDPAAGVRVEVLSEARERVAPDEARRLGLPAGARARVREVALMGGARPWVFARSVLPAWTLAGPARGLARLGSRPLGAALFAQPGLERGPIELIRIALDALPRAVRAAPADGERRRDAWCWGRRSVFRIAGRPLLVCEFFLPALVERLRC